MKPSKKQTKQIPKKRSDRLRGEPVATTYAMEKMAQLNSSFLSLDTFTPTKKMPKGEPWDTIRYLYAQHSLRFRVMATILNGAVSQKKPTFLLSRDLLEKYLKLDGNIKRDTLNGTESAKVMDQLLATMNGSSFLKCLVPFVPPSKGEQGKAGTYTFGEQKTFDLLGEWAQSYPLNLPPSPTSVYVGVYEPEREREGVSEVELDNQGNPVSENVRAARAAWIKQQGKASS